MAVSDSQTFLRELDKKRAERHRLPPRAARRGRAGARINLWTAADRLRSNIDAAVYNHVVHGQFALAEEKSGGHWSGVTKASPQESPKGWRECANQFLKPKSIVDLIAEMIAPYHARVYDPAMGSGGFFVSPERFIEEHGGNLADRGDEYRSCWVDSNSRDGRSIVFMLNPQAKLN